MFNRILSREVGGERIAVENTIALPQHVSITSVALFRIPLSCRQVDHPAPDMFFKPTARKVVKRDKVQVPARSARLGEVVAGFAVEKVSQRLTFFRSAPALG